MRKILLLGTILVCCCSSLLWAQEKSVTGTVTAVDDGSPIPGVNVVVAGTNNGVITDMDGKYKIAVPDQGKLIFSFVGMISQEITFSNLTEIDVKLVSDARILSEVVVTGSGVATSKAKLGISVETISAKSLPQTPSASVDQALIGKIPGAQITSGNGTPGAPVNILLRGINSVNRGTMPMILIDGIQVASTDLNSIDLNSIERIEGGAGCGFGVYLWCAGCQWCDPAFYQKR